MSDFLAALGLLFIFEGLIYGGAPHAAKRMAEQMIGLPEAVLRAIGLGAMAIGLGIIWFVRG